VAALSMPKVGFPIGGWNLKGGITPEQVLGLARRAEELGIDSLFAGDHVTFYGFGNDGLQTLTAVAAVTETIELKTSVYLLALRHPMPVALQVAILDQLSHGRFILGVGVGGEDPHEFTSCGVEPKTRGARTDEAIQLLRRVWTEDEVTFQGRYFQLDRVRLEPKPFHGNGVLIYVGGRSDAALRRAAVYGDGWTGIWNSPRRLREAREKIDAWAAEAGRSGADIELGMQIWFSLDEDRQKARDRVAARMEAAYQTPFTSFERYVPYGPPAAVVEFIAPYLEGGCRHLNLVTVQESPEAELEAVVAVKEAIAGAV
jgi:probable F420-dependent oxidoreductase